MNTVPLTIAAAAEGLRSGAWTSVELTAACYGRADALDERLGAYLFRGDEAALAAAARADAELAAGRDRGPLHGIPVGVKDILATTDGPTTAQSLALDPEWGARADAFAVARLREAGAVVTGKTTTMEFAIGMPDPAKPFPVPRTPWSEANWAGGSSSGTAIGVACGMFLGGIGTDTGGSIRLPSAFCGITGLKPTFGLVSKEGCFPLAGTLDHVGPMARTATDCALMLEAMAGFDRNDSFSIEAPVPDYTADLARSLRGLRIGVEREHHLAAPGIDPVAVDRFEAAVSVLTEGGASVTEVSLPFYDALSDAAGLTMFAEAFSYHRQNLERRWSDYGVYTREAIALGALYTAADYVLAQRVRRAGRRALTELFADVDLIVCPTVGAGPPRIEGLTLLSVLTLPVFTGVWNALGSPVLSVPIGFDGAGLPLGMQMAGRDFDETTVLRAGHAYQEMTDWHQALPPLVTEATAPSPSTTSAVT